MIERVLRSLHLWDPPWKREHPVLGPPPSSRDGPAPSPADAQRQRGKETFEAEAIDIDPIIDDELYVVDPVPQEEDDAPA